MAVAGQTPDAVVHRWNFVIGFVVFVCFALWAIADRECQLREERSKKPKVALSVIVEGANSYGRSVAGKLSSATVDVKVTATNIRGLDVRISSLRCDLHRKRFWFGRQRLDSLPYFHHEPLDWLLRVNGPSETRSVIFSRRLDSPWASARARIGESISVRMVAVLSGGGHTATCELPKIPVRGPYLTSS